MANFYDVSNWNEKPHFQTGGTRSKCILENEEGDLYYFKTSLKKIDKDYKYEFWSEIIASEIGNKLGFNVLEYNIAYYKNEIGCISKSMIDSEVETLCEGKNYLVGYDPTYNPEDKTMKKKYSFSFIHTALQDYKLEKHIYSLIETIIFDSIVGNGDRHQENWGFIIPNIYKSDINGKKELRIKLINKIFSNLFFQLFLKLHVWLKINKGINIFRLFSSKNNYISKRIIEDFKGKYSPIYDSGSCLGRELTDEKMNELLINEKALDAYIRKGKSEIHWDGHKLSHFDLIINLKANYSDLVRNKIEKVLKLSKEINISDIVNNIDINLPMALKTDFSLPKKRKDLIAKIIENRLIKLEEIL